MTTLHRERLAFSAIVVTLLFCGVAAWIATILLGGRLLATVVALVGTGLLVIAGWRLHARVALPRARARRNRGRR